MAQKKYQRGIIHSSETIKIILDHRIDDIALLTKQTTSNIVENALLDGLFPKNRDARDIIQANLYGDTDNRGVKETLIALFRFNSTGCNWLSKYRNFMPLLDFCLLYVDKQARLSDNNGVFTSFLNDFHSIANYTERCAQQIPDHFERSEYKSITNWIKMLYDTACNDPSKIYIIELFKVIKDLWLMIDDWNTTYFLLESIVTMGEFIETVESRNELYNIVDTISQEWGD